MVDSASMQNELASRMGDRTLLDSGTIYRGGTVRGFNDHEFGRNAIEGSAFDVFELSGDPAAAAGSATTMMGKNPRDIEGLTFENHYEPDVTGGMTHSLGTAAFFGHGSGMAEDLPLVLFLDPGLVEDDIFAVDYSYEWFNTHPGILSHVETLADGEIHINGALWATTDSRAGEGAEVQAWGKDRMHNRATSPTYQPEKEVVADAPKVDLDSAYLGVAAYYQEPGPMGNSISTVLNELPGYAQMPRLGSDAEDLSNMNAREMALAAYDETTAMMQYDTDDFWVVVTRSPTSGGSRFDKGDEQMDANQFMLATDGDTVTENPGDVPPHLLGQ